MKDTKLKSYIKSLEKKKIISKKPNPIIPFILTSIIFILLFIKTHNLPLTISIYILFIFSLIFSIIHLIIYKLLTA